MAWKLAQKRKKISKAVDTGLGLISSIKGKAAAVAPKSNSDAATTATNGDESTVPRGKVGSCRAKVGAKGPVGSPLLSL